MLQSRLARSSNASLRDMASIVQYCKKYGIPHVTDFLPTIAPEPFMRANFRNSYEFAQLPPVDMKQHGTSTVLVFESEPDAKNQQGGFAPYHGHVVSAVAQMVGKHFEPHVDTMFIKQSLNPNYRGAFEQNNAAVSALVENQGVPVLHTSIGWDDKLLDFDINNETQANHLWRVTAFVVDSAGNDGWFSSQGDWRPYQKHNALTHFAPLVVHVGAAAKDATGAWNIEGYSSANSPTFLAPVAPQTMVQWDPRKEPASLTGTSAAAPYVSGMLAALNYRYGAHLTREQILYAVLATCEPVTHVNAFGNHTPQERDVTYKKNAAGLGYNPEYGGFGLVDMKKADKVLSHMVALTQENPESITVPTEERVLHVSSEDDNKRGADNLYHYKVKMPAGFALKTTVEAEYVSGLGAITITSPSGTNLPMVMSELKWPGKFFSMSTSHGWAGEQLEGEWIVTSATPIKRLRLNQHHFLSKDIIHQLDIPALLEAPAPNLQDALPLSRLIPDHTTRILHTITPQSQQEGRLRIDENGEAPVLGNAADTIAQLKKLPSAFAVRHRNSFLPTLPLYPDSEAGTLEIEAIDMVRKLTFMTTGKDELRHKIIAKQLAAADAYNDSGNILAQVTPLCNAAYNYLACENDKLENAEKAVEIYRRALKISKNAGLYTKAYEISCNLYTVLCRCCEYGKSDEYQPMLEGVRRKTMDYSRHQQGELDHRAYRIEEGEYGFSSKERIGTDNVSQCIALIVQDPLTMKTGLAHIDNENDIKSLDKFFAHFGQHRLKIRLVGARFDEDFRTQENITNVMDYLSHKNADIISADIYGGNDGPSAVTVNPATFTLEEKVPDKRNLNEAISNAIMLFTHKGKPLIEQFDFTASHARAPIHLNARMLGELREKYFGRKEWEVEGYLGAQAVYDRPLLVTHVHGLEHAYNEQWEKLSAAMDEAIAEHHIIGAQAQQAREALVLESLYIGENASAANAPIFDWIKNRLFKDDMLQRSELVGPTATLNIYDPQGLPEPVGFAKHAQRGDMPQASIF